MKAALTLFLALISAIAFAQAERHPAPDAAIERAVESLLRGDFVSAARDAASSAQRAEAQSDWRGATRARGLEGDALWQAGHRIRAREAWAAALEAAKQSGDAISVARALSSFAASRTAPEERAEALAQHLEAVRLAREAGDAPTLAATLANQGNALALARRYAEAEAAFEAALRQMPFGDIAGRARLAANLVRLAGEQGRAADAVNRIDALEALVGSGLDARASSIARLSAAQAALAFDARAASAELRGAAAKLLRAASPQVEASGDRRLASLLYGLTGRVNAANGERAAALDDFARASRHAQLIEAPELLYQWQWEAGRLYVAEGERDRAIRAYRGAVSALQAARGDLGAESGGAGLSFREVYAPLYYELADLVLQRATGERASQAKRALLEEARTTVELLKAAELEDYFQDGCVAAQQARVKRVEEISRDVAFIYPIVLRDRLELLVSHAGGIEQFTVPVPQEKLVAEVRGFRLRLERRTTRQFLLHAQALYAWLFKPLESTLSGLGITTVVMVPESFLRTIPFAALHDGKDYLVRRFAFATTPGLDLTDPRPLAVREARVLLTGITESVQGFSALPNVGAELESIGKTFPARVLKDREYSLGAMQSEFGPAAIYSIVHIASHGQFEADPQRSFLLTYDDKLTMNRLEKLIAPSRYRDQPIELLTLSACQTAAGDDRAALGLAGVAIKAGARSALASLWFVNDESSAILIGEFYQQLRVTGATKSRALQLAQLKLLEDKRFNHPAYWGAFLLIGNWL